jgi:hypothetical protein
LALATLTCLLLAGCSPGADFPSLFPAVHDTPPPRTDPTMNSLELQKATEDLITERDRLNAQAPQHAPQNAQGKNATNTAKDKVTGSVAKATVPKGAPQQAAAAPPATTASAQGAGVTGAGVTGAGVTGAGMQAAGADPKP